MKCSNCGSKATEVVHKGGKYVGLGAILSIFVITALIGVPMIIYGLCIYLKYVGKDEYPAICTCKTCKYQEIINVKR